MAAMFTTDTTQATDTPGSATYRERHYTHVRYLMRQAKATDFLYWLLRYPFLRLNGLIVTVARYPCDTPCDIPCDIPFWSTGYPNSDTPIGIQPIL
jgi:hypothetical protein